MMWYGLFAFYPFLIIYTYNQSNIKKNSQYLGMQYKQVKTKTPKSSFERLHTRIPICIHITHTYAK